MKSIFYILICISLTGCLHRLNIHDIDYEDTKQVSSSDIKKLPVKLTYGQLIKLWGPANTGDPFFSYRSKIDGISLGVVCAPKGYATQSHQELSKINPSDYEVISMFFFHDHGYKPDAWGLSYEQLFNPTKKPDNTDKEDPFAP
jgi:hypothetical protein